MRVIQTLKFSSTNQHIHILTATMSSAPSQQQRPQSSNHKSRGYRPRRGGNSNSRGHGNATAANRGGSGTARNTVSHQQHNTNSLKHHSSSRQHQDAVDDDQDVEMQSELETATNHQQQQQSTAAAATPSTANAFLTTSAFASLPLHPGSQRALREVFGYAQMSRVQAECIPLALQGHDVLAKAKTGSGKTLAFLLPLVERLTTATSSSMRNAQQPALRSLVLSPTRELAQQIADEAEKLLSCHKGLTCVSVVGGTNINSDQRALKNGASVLVGTPGRTLDLLQNWQPLQSYAKELAVLVLDEADRLLDAGFRRELTAILAFLPKQRQTLLFSATVSSEVQSIAQLACTQEKPIFVDCVDANDSNSNEAIDQSSMIVPFDQHIAALYSIVHDITRVQRPNDYKVLVFFNTARVTSFMAQIFNIAGINTLELHSRKSQSQRQKISDEFRVNARRVMFSSDVSARGLDYENVTHVIAVGLPADREQYIHRVGRTGRAGAGGEAIIMLVPFEAPFLRQLKDLNVKPFAVTSPALQQLINGNDAGTPAQLRNALTRVERDSSLQQSAEQAYSSWIGFYNGHLKLMGWNKHTLVEQAARYAELLGLSEVPALSPKAVAMMGLKGLVRVAKQEQRQGRGGGSQRGVGASQRGGRGQQQQR